MRHAASGASRKTRNADLRRRGIDPDGADGEAYRRFFEAAKTGRFVAKIAEEMAASNGRPNHVILWDLPQEEFSAWVERCQGGGTWEDYQRKLHAAIENIEAAGIPVITIRPTVAEILATIAAGGLKNDAAGRAAAIGMIAIKISRSAQSVIHDKINPKNFHDEKNKP
jgi:hypothetical protein